MEPIRNKAAHTASIIARLVFIIAAISPRVGTAQSYGELDTGFRFSLFRSEAAPIGLVAALTTTADYPCEGYRLRTKVTHQRDTVTISILGMIQPSPCYAAYAKATGAAFLGNKVGGKYIVRFLYRGVRDLYRLSFVDSQIVLVPISTSFTEHKPVDSYDQE